MKWVEAGVVTIVIALLISIGFGWTDMRPPGEKAGILIVPDTARPRATPTIAGPVVPVSEAAIILPPRPEVTTTTETDTEALAALFDTQARDPVWAPGAEASIRSHIPVASEARCAEFMCRIAMPLPDRSMTKSADEQAAAASRYWSNGLSYNRLTAMIVGDRSPTLIFYVTRLADEDEIGS